MDDKILFYIILGVIYFLFSRLKKKKPAEEQDSDSSESPEPRNGPRPISFEELLKEITEAKQQVPPPQQPVVNRKIEFETAKPKPSYVDYDDDLEDEVKSLEKMDDDRSNKVYEEAKKLAFNRPSLEETLKLKEVNTEYAKFKQFEAKADSGILAEYVKELRDPKGLKKALILNEVMNRKHF